MPLLIEVVTEQDLRDYVGDRLCVEDAKAVESLLVEDPQARAHVRRLAAGLPGTPRRIFAGDLTAADGPIAANDVPPSNGRRRPQWAGGTGRGSSGSSRFHRN